MEMTRKDKISYGLGGLGKNLAYGLVSNYTLYYYNSVMGISAAFIGTLLMAARIFDAFNDPLMGVVVAKTHSKYGRYKPWILTGAILNSFVMYAMFTIPGKLDGNPLKWYVAITYFLCGITYTLSDIPYWSIIPAITRAGKERESVTVYSRTFSGIGAVLPIVFGMAVVMLLGWGKGDLAERIGFSRFALIIGILYIVLTVKAVKHLPNNEISEYKGATVKELLGSLVTNDQALVLACTVILFNGALYLITNMIIYVFRYDICNEWYYTAFMFLSGVFQFLGMIWLYPKLRKKYTNRQCFIFADISGIIGFAVLATIIPVKHLTFAYMIIPGIFISMANGIMYVLVSILVAGAVDYGEQKTGQRNSSVITSLQTLMAKLASALAVFIAGVGIDMAGIDESAVTQAADAIKNLRILCSIPGVIMVAASLLILLAKKSIGRDIDKTDKTEN